MGLAMRKGLFYTLRLFLNPKGHYKIAIFCEIQYKRTEQSFCDCRMVQHSKLHQLTKLSLLIELKRTSQPPIWNSLSNRQQND
ncbi:hypothetical protein BpHYR1_024029 [Brachionus plicatilis]|uniref:Uncharacterized protein n=1 Tax=Brachionus plicatilis TaxID=10195 RepID=A0A3M7SIQ1_BRAPC|nr:hypothetical protein BpHYR1_024029 [Brachionus plicatilis]